MSKRAREAPTLMEEFEPFWQKNGLIWVPYWSGGKLYQHCLAPSVALKGCGYVAQLLGNGANIIHFTAAVLNRRGREREAREA